MEHRDLGLPSLEELTPKFFQNEEFETFSLSVHCVNDSTGEYCFRADYTVKNDLTEYFSLI